MKPINYPPVNLSQADMFAFEAVLAEIVLGVVSIRTYERVMQLEFAMDIEEYDFLLAIAGTDPETCNWHELGKLCLNMLVNQMIEHDPRMVRYGDLYIGDRYSISVNRDTPRTKGYEGSFAPSPDTYVFRWGG